MNGLNNIMKETELKIKKSQSLYDTSVNQLKDYLYDMNNSATNQSNNQ